MTLIDYEGHHPQISDKAWLAESASIIGDVAIEENSSVWYNAVIRGDGVRIRIGKNVAVEDLVMIHGNTVIEDNVVIGHTAILHGCYIEKNCLIGMGSIIMDGAHIGEGSIVGAGTLITSGKVFPPYSVIYGDPAAVQKNGGKEQYYQLKEAADNYYEYAVKQLLPAPEWLEKK